MEKKSTYNDTQYDIKTTIKEPVNDTSYYICQLVIYVCMINKCKTKTVERRKKNIIEI